MCDVLFFCQIPNPIKIQYSILFLIDQRVYLCLFSNKTCKGLDNITDWQFACVPYYTKP
jgi:hypothetical protein